MKETRYAFIFGGAIGDALLGIHIGRTLAANKRETRLVMLSTRKNDFVRELVEGIPFITYQELPSRDIRSWIRLVGMMASPWKSVVYEPFVAPLSAWWKIVLWCLTRRKGSLSVHCQIHERAVPNCAQALLYDSRTDNLFYTVPKVVRLWGIDVAQEPQPFLEVPTNCALSAEPYLLFHFFAAAYRRSLPTDHARELLLVARKEFPQHAFVVTCAHGEEGRAKRITEDIDNVRLIVNPHARELLCLLAQADTCVGVASGVTHIAAHLPKPSVILCNLSDPCWLPHYNPEAVLLYERTRCGCNGDKTGKCEQVTPEGVVYRCLYDIKTERIIGEMKKIVTR